MYAMLFPMRIAEITGERRPSAPLRLRHARLSCTERTAIALVVAVLRAALCGMLSTPLPAEGNVCGCFVTNPELERAGESVAS